jgi:hypothetical protein
VGGCGFAGKAWLDTLGKPDVVTANEPGIPTNILAAFALVICGLSFTFNVKDCVADPVEALSVSNSTDWPPVPAAGVPLIVALFPLALNWSPAGSESARLIVPSVAETVYEPSLPAANVAEFGVVNTGRSVTVMDNDAVIFESNRNGPYSLFRQRIDEQEPEPLVLSNTDNILAEVSPDGKWVLYREDREKGTKMRFMRVPMKGGTPEPIPGTDNVECVRCGHQPGSRCVLRSTENDQFVFYELDPLRGRGRELARTVWSPTTQDDWNISPDGRFAAMPNHDPRTAIIRVISLDATRADAAERAVTINGMKNLYELVWAANGEGWYAVEVTPLDRVLFYVDADGAHSWELVRSSMVLWAVPSPGGRKIAFPQDTPWSNVYLVKGFR